MTASLLVLLILIAVPAYAVPAKSMLSSFDAVESGTPDANALDFAEVVTGSGTDSQCEPSITTPHQTSDGGADNSSRSYRFVMTSGGGCYIRHLKSGDQGTGLPEHPDAPFDGLNVAAMGVSVYLESITGTRKLLAFEESDGGVGCYVQVKSDRTLEVLYGNSNPVTVGTTTLKLQSGSCSSDATILCTVNSDCPATDTCSLEGWAGVELVQSNQASRVSCDLWLNGLAVVAAAPVNIPSGETLGTITNVRVGPSGSETNSITVNIDDYVFQPSALRAGFGYVDFAVMSSVGRCTDNQAECVKDADCNVSQTCASMPGGRLEWNRTPASANHADTLDDFQSGGTFDSGTSFIKRGSKVSTDLFVAPRTSYSIGSADTITAVEAVVYAATNTTNNTHEFTQGIGFCPAGACQLNISSVVSMTTDTNYRQEARLYSTDRGDSQPWSPGDLTSLSWEANITPDNKQTVKISAVAIWIRVQHPDAPLPITLVDHNYGTDDSRVVVAAMSDSLGGGTGGSQCAAGSAKGQPCSQTWYCEWNTFKDVPEGGCVSHSQCRTCDQQRSLFGGLGLSCTATADCTGTCDAGGHCTNAQTVSCTVNTDCDFGTCPAERTCTGGSRNGLACQCDDPTNPICDDPNTGCPGGTCESAADCVPSCPVRYCSLSGGTECLVDSDCPSAETCGPIQAITCFNPGGWIGKMITRVGADEKLKYSKGAETSANLVDFLPKIIRGVGIIGRLAAGDGTCQCQIDADCGTGGVCSTSTHYCTAGNSQYGCAGTCICLSDADCGSGGLCQGKHCLLGSNEGVTCAADSDCSGGECAGICTAGDVDRINCSDAQSCGNCNGSTIRCDTGFNKLSCRFDPPDYIMFGAAGADMLLLLPNPNCSPTGDQTACAKVGDTQISCTTDSQCSALGSTSKCVGTRTGATAGLNRACIGGQTDTDVAGGPVLGCTAGTPFCSQLSDCAPGSGYVSCIGGTVDEPSTLTTAFSIDPQGYCTCDANTVCAGHCFDQTDKQWLAGKAVPCATDADCANPFVNVKCYPFSCGENVCRLQCGCEGGCSVSGDDCDADSDCPITETCTNPAPGTCGGGPPTFCTGGKRNGFVCGSDMCSPAACNSTAVTDICEGECSKPCDRFTCTTDEDCTMTTSEGYITRGQCVNGHCAGCGQSICPVFCDSSCSTQGNCFTDADCGTCSPGDGCGKTGSSKAGLWEGAAAAHWNSQAVSENAELTLRNMDTALKIVADLPESDGRPLMTLATLIEFDRLETCDTQIQPAILSRVSSALRTQRTRFPYVWDARRAVATRHKPQCLSGSHAGEVCHAFIPCADGAPCNSTDSDICYIDFFHFNDTCSVAMGTEAADLLNALNVCGKGYLCHGGPQAGTSCTTDSDCMHCSVTTSTLCSADSDCPNVETCIATTYCERIKTVVKYCQKPDLTFESPAVTCTADSDCTVGDRCARRSCTVATEATDCPASGDSCNPE